MMSRMLVVLSVAALLMAACEKKQEVQAPAPQAVQDQSGTDPRPGEAAESPAETGTAPTMGDIREAREETVALPQEEPKSVEPAPPEPKAVKETESPRAEKQEKAPAEKPAKAKGAAPETVVLANKQGDITFPHKAHAELTECGTCHGDKGPGKLDLNRDSGHKLCLGCHKEQGAGPTSCSGCHKKS